jgi:hypothetical protein
MNDLEKAKTQLNTKQLTLAIVKNGKALYETQFHRISGFLTAIEQQGKNLQNASVADKVVGKAVALLCVYAKVKAVYAETLSAAGKAVLEQNGIASEWAQLVDTILDDKKQGLCPFEKEAVNVTDPKLAYDRFKALHPKMRACRRL